MDPGPCPWRRPKSSDLGASSSDPSPRSLASAVLTVGQNVAMVFGAHLVLFSSDADADRSFLAEVFGLKSVDAGGGWLIFALPPAEVAVHPADTPGAELYLMCEDLASERRSLVHRGVNCSDVEQAPWGSVTKIQLPSGGQLGLYQPRHPTAIGNPAVAADPGPRRPRSG